MFLNLAKKKKKCVLMKKVKQPFHRFYMLKHTYADFL